MIKIILLLCLVWGCLGQFYHPDWSANGLTGHRNQKFPALPRSFPIFADASTSKSNTELTEPPTTKSPPPASTTIPTTPATTTIPTTPAPITTTKAPSTCTGMFSCADCGTSQICRPTATGFVPLHSTPCPTDKPYCKAASGTCSSVPDDTCGLSDNFVCPTEGGYYPDPTNCTIYHACNNYQSQMFKCAEKQVYDPEKNECRVGAECNYNIDCTGVSGTKLEMGDTHYYTFCSGGHPMVVSRCEDPYKLNSTSQICEPICEKEGLMRDLDDCTKFYECKTVNFPPNPPFMTRRNLDCPAGEAFDPNSYQCIPKTMTQCKK